MERMNFSPELVDIAEKIRDVGGEAFAVGGHVRDFFRNEASADIDVEVFGINLQAVRGILIFLGDVKETGAEFGILKFRSNNGLEIDFSSPRRDNRIGVGHRGFMVEFDPTMTIEAAAMRRDFTMNALSANILTGEIIDPCNGLQDLHRDILRVIDPERFGEDALRVLRAAKFIARFDIMPDDQLVEICRGIDLSVLSQERMFAEMVDLLDRGVVPSQGLEFLRECGALRFFPELEAMVGVEQEPEWHPEGTVWEHTLMVVDEAAFLRNGDHSDEDLILMFAALLHDTGKPATTEVIDGRICSRGHEEAGAGPTTEFLERLKAPKSFTKAIVALVIDHLAPHHLATGGAKRGAFRRLGRRLMSAGTNMVMLHRLGTADHFGRGTDDAKAREYPQGDVFLTKAHEAMTDLEVELGPQDVVMGRHLIDRGLTPGEEFGILLSECREVQDETGAQDPEAILDRVLGKAKE